MEFTGFSEIKCYINGTMENNNTPYKTSQYQDEQFYCPNCNEFLHPVDIETVSRCPYCDTVIPRDDHYEDYVLRPVIKMWVERQNKQFPRHG